MDKTIVGGKRAQRRLEVAIECAPLGEVSNLYQVQRKSVSEISVHFGGNDHVIPTRHDVVNILKYMDIFEGERAKAIVSVPPLVAVKREQDLCIDDFIRIDDQGVWLSHDIMALLYGNPDYRVEVAKFFFHHDKALETWISSLEDNMVPRHEIMRKTRGLRVTHAQELRRCITQFLNGTYSRAKPGDYHTGYNSSFPEIGV